MARRLLAVCVCEDVKGSSVAGSSFQSNADIAFDVNIDADGTLAFTLTMPTAVLPARQQAIDIHTGLSIGHRRGGGGLYRGARGRTPLQRATCPPRWKIPLNQA